MKDRRGLRVNHKQVRIKHRGRDVEVDELLAPVIRDLWRQGFRTVSSCQGDPKWITGADGTRARVSLAWIGFRSMREAKRFQRAIVGGRNHRTDTRGHGAGGNGQLRGRLLRAGHGGRHVPDSTRRAGAAAGEATEAK